MSGAGSRDITFGCLSGTGGDSSVIDFVNRVGGSVFQVNTLTQTITAPNANSFTISKDAVVSGNANLAHIKSSTGTNTMGGNLRVNGNATIGASTGTSSCKVVGRLEGFVIPLVFSTTNETASSGGYGYYGALRCTGSRGWVAPGAGSVCAISGSYSSTDLANPIEVRRNGTSIWQIALPSEQATADVYKSRAKDSATFARGDNVEVYFGGGVYNAVLTVLVIVDTWDDDGVVVN